MHQNPFLTLTVVSPNNQIVTFLLLSVTIVVNGEEGGVGTLGSESFPTCLSLRLASQGPGGIITNIRPTKSLRLILGLISEINLAEIKLKD